MPILFPTSPTVGQVFTSGGRSWVWSGATWDSPTATNTLLAPYGSELIGSSDFTNQSSVSIDNIFTSSYDFYEIKFSFVAVSSATNMGLRLRASGVDLASGYAFNRIVATGSGSPAAFPLSGESSWRAGVARTTNRSILNVTLANPYKAGLAKNYLYQEFNQEGSTLEINVGGGINSATGLYDGLKFIPASGNITGSIRVYGLRN